MRERGLKQYKSQGFELKLESLPMRERGLKPIQLDDAEWETPSLPMRERGLKLLTLYNAVCADASVERCSPQA